MWCVSDPDTQPSSSHYRNSTDYYKSHVPWGSSLLAHHFYPRLSAPDSLLLDQEGDGQGHYGGHLDPLASDRSGVGGGWGGGGGGGGGGDGRGASRCVVAGKRLVPKLHPRRLGPLRRGGGKDGGGGGDRRALSERAGHGNTTGNGNPPTLERNKTDYEPIEDIAKRNRIHFSRYLSSRDGATETKSKEDNSTQAAQQGAVKNSLAPVAGRGGGGGTLVKGGGFIAGRSNLSVVANPGDITHRDM